jgi:hypothetical protein
VTDGSEERTAEIAFETGGSGEPGPSIKLNGIPEEVLRSPEKIRKLMELLELPEGTNARVTVSTSTLVIR